MKRQSAKAITIETNVRCVRVYPTESTKRTMADLKTVGIRLTKEQALHLARVLLAVTQEWDVIDITAYRLRRRHEDSTYTITVTSLIENAEEQEEENG
jgi:hypothetical protein